MTSHHFASLERWTSLENLSLPVAQVQVSDFLDPQGIYDLHDGCYFLHFLGVHEGLYCGVQLGGLNSIGITMGFQPHKLGFGACIVITFAQHRTTNFVTGTAPPIVYCRCFAC